MIVVIVVCSPSTSSSSSSSPFSLSFSFRVGRPRPRLSRPRPRLRSSLLWSTCILLLVTACTRAYTLALSLKMHRGSTHIYIRIYIHTYIQACVSTNIHVHIYIYTHAHTNAQITHPTHHPHTHPPTHPPTHPRTHAHTTTKNKRNMHTRSLGILSMRPSLHPRDSKLLVQYAGELRFTFGIGSILESYMDYIGIMVPKTG